MSYVMRQVAHCDVCSHEWLVVTDKVPSHCAKCKSRKWNSYPVGFGHVEPLPRGKAAKRVITNGSLVEPTAYMKGRYFTIPHAHDSKTCRIYKCGMCAAKKGKAK